MSTRTPISDLLGKSEPPAPASQPGPRNPSGVGGWLVVLVLAGVLAFVAWDRNDRAPNPKPDNQEQVEPAPQPSPKVVGKTLVFVHERNPQPIEHDLLLREMPKFCGDRKLQFRDLDDDLSEEVVKKLIEFARSKGVESPFVVLTDSNDKPWRVIKWPNDIAGLGGLFK